MKSKTYKGDPNKTPKSSKKLQSSNSTVPKKKKDRDKGLPKPGVKQLNLLAFKKPSTPTTNLISSPNNKPHLSTASKLNNHESVAEISARGNDLAIPEAKQSSNFDITMLGLHTSTVCFICNKKLDTLSIVKVTKHINDCLDNAEMISAQLSQRSLVGESSLIIDSSSSSILGNTEAGKNGSDLHIDSDFNNSSLVIKGVNTKSRTIIEPKQTKIAISSLESQTIDNPQINHDQISEDSSQGIIESSIPEYNDYPGSFSNLVIDRYLPASGGNSPSRKRNVHTSTSDSSSKILLNKKPKAEIQALSSPKQNVDTAKEPLLEKPNKNISSTSSCIISDSDNSNSPQAHDFMKKKTLDKEKNLLKNFEDPELSGIGIISANIPHQPNLNLKNEYEDSLDNGYSAGFRNNNFIEPLLKISDKNYVLDTSSQYLIHNNNQIFKKKSCLLNPEMKAEVLQRELNKAISWNKKYLLAKISNLPFPNEKNCKPSKKKCPSHKFMPGTSFTVDAFAYGKIPECTGYFLTHFHSDHYGGLTSKFSHGMIYCSQITGNLIIENLKVDSQYVCRLPLNWPILIENAVVTLFDANHCPGSVMFFFDTLGSSKGDTRERILHTGDFRACPDHVRHLNNTISIYNMLDLNRLRSSGIELNIGDSQPKDGTDSKNTKKGTIFGFYALEKAEEGSQVNVRSSTKEKSVDNLLGTVSDNLADYDSNSGRYKDDLPPTMNLISKIYLDTTYMKSDYTFPAQQEVIEAVTNLCKIINDNPEERLLHVKAARDTTSAKTVVKSIRGTDGPSDSISTVDELTYTSSLTKWFKPSFANLFKTSILKNNIIEKKTLFVVGTYLIGKERLFIEIANKIGSKVYVEPKKKKTLSLFEDDSLIDLLTEKPEEAQVHVVSLNNVKKQLMEDYLSLYSNYFHSLVAFRPTGWTFQSSMGHPEYVSTSKLGPKGAPSFIPHKLRMDIPAADDLKRVEFYMDTVIKTGTRSPLLLSFELGSKCVPSLPPVSFTKTSIKPFGNSDRITIFPVPYSEHSSYRELAAFVCSVACDEIIPTVDCEKPDKLARMNKIFELWKRAKKVVESVRLDSIEKKGTKKVADHENSLQLPNSSENNEGVDVNMAQGNYSHLSAQSSSSGCGGTKSDIDTLNNEPDSAEESINYTDIKPQNLDNDNGNISRFQVDTTDFFPKEAVLMVPTRCQGAYW